MASSSSIINWSDRQLKQLQQIPANKPAQKLEEGSKTGLFDLPREIRDSIYLTFLRKAESTQEQERYIGHFRRRSYIHDNMYASPHYWLTPLLLLNKQIRDEVVMLFLAKHIFRVYEQWNPPSLPVQGQHTGADLVSRVQHIAFGSSRIFGYYDSGCVRNLFAGEIDRALRTEHSIRGAQKMLRILATFPNLRTVEVDFKLVQICMEHSPTDSAIAFKRLQAVNIVHTLCTSTLRPTLVRPGKEKGVHHQSGTVLQATIKLSPKGLWWAGGRFENVFRAAKKVLRLEAATMTNQYRDVLVEGQTYSVWVHDRLSIFW